MRATPSGLWEVIDVLGGGMAGWPHGGGMHMVGGSMAGWLAAWWGAVWLAGWLRHTAYAGAEFMAIRASLVMRSDE